MKQECIRAKGVTSMTAEIAAAFVGHNTIKANEVPELIKAIYRSLELANEGTSDVKEHVEPAVSPQRSVKPGYLVCLEDGRKLKLLKRHLRTQHGMTPDQYRERWSLKSDYPMVAPRYAAKRGTIAKSMGLGKKPRRKNSKSTGRSAHRPAKKAA
jgi:predicted transcriptional regulator